MQPGLSPGRSRISTTHPMDAFFLKPILNSPYEYPGRHWELDEHGQPTNRIHRRAATRRADHADSRCRGSSAASDSSCSTRRRRSSRPTVSSTTRRRSSTTCGVSSMRGAQLPPNQWQVTPETARLLRHWRHHSTDGIRPFFCQVEAVGGRDLADRGRTQIGNRAPLPRPPAVSERAIESGAGSARPEARHRRRQDDRHGHAHRLADDQRGPPPGQPSVHPWLPAGHPGLDHPRPVARAPAQRPRQLLPRPRTGAERPPGRAGPSQDRHHQLPRLHASGDPGAVERVDARSCRDAAPS